MKKSTYILLIVTLLASVLLASTASAQADVNIFPFDDGATYRVTTSDDLEIVWGWIATTKGLVRVFLNAYDVSLTLTNMDTGDVVFSVSEDEAEGVWSPLQPLPCEFLGLECPMKGIWFSFWAKDIGRLEAGSYSLVTMDRLNHPVNDGFHVTRVDGERVVPPPSLYQFEDTYTVYIEVSP